MHITMKNMLGATLACALLGAGFACATTPAQAATQKVPAGVTYSFDGACSDCHTVEAASYGTGEEATDSAASGKTADSKSAKATAESTAKEVSAEEAGAAAQEGNCPALLEVDAHQSFGCTTCHDDQETMDSIHKDVAEGDRIPKRLKKSEVDPQICLTCHESYESLAKGTQDSTALTDSKGTVVNPHEVVDLNDDHKNALNCFSCHEAHGDDAVADSAARSCESCHHTNVYECYTCHE